jgi:hypothetical protein
MSAKCRYVDNIHIACYKNPNAERCTEITNRKTLQIPDTYINATGMYV